jgi:hypothetical protein
MSTDISLNYEITTKRTDSPNNSDDSDKVYTPGSRDLLMNTLDGKTFIRKVIPTKLTDGMFGQRKGGYTHTVSFNDGVVRDNIGVRLGGRPKTLQYWVDGNDIIGNEDSLIKEPIMSNSIKLYTIVDDNTIRNSVGAVLQLMK